MEVEQEVRCPCGKPLHYASDKLRESVEKLVAQLGPDVTVTRLSAGGGTGGKGSARETYLVSRHYASLHGLSSWDLPKLAQRGIARRV